MDNYPEHLPKLSDPPQRVAVIDEDVCIGCTKCITACPFDAILGAAKQMHTVLTALCTGCELCIPPCPVDCIAMRPFDEPRGTSWAQAARARYNARLRRLDREQQVQTQRRRKTRVTTAKNREQIKAEIAAAVARTRAKRSRGG